MVPTFEEIRQAKLTLALAEAYELTERLKQFGISEGGEPAHVCNQEELAYFLDTTTQSIGKWRKDQGLPHLPHSATKYDLRLAYDWFKKNKPSKHASLDAARKQEIESLIKGAL